MKIIVSEYPKSGGTWVVSMLGDALDLPKRDIYVGNGYQAFDVRKHPWYINAADLELSASCIVKSHELPDSHLVRFPARFIHLVRDGRDVVVSKYFYEKDFCVANGISTSFEAPFDEYVRRVAGEWHEYLVAWLRLMPHYYRYEDCLKDPARVLQNMLNDLEVVVPEAHIWAAVQTNSKDRLRRAFDQTFAHNTFVRQGLSGDWRNYFSAGNVRDFKALAGQLLIDLGYERDFDW